MHIYSIEPIFYTYLFRDPSRNNEPIYVGKGKDLRAFSHLKFTKRNKGPFVNRIKKMLREGIEPVVEFLAKDIPEEKAFSLEMWFIFKYGRKDLKRGTLLNLTDGGDGQSGRLCSPETRAKRSATMKGMKPSVESNLKRSISLRGKNRIKRSEEEKAVIKIKRNKTVKEKLRYLSKMRITWSIARINQISF